MELVTGVISMSVLVCCHPVVYVHSGLFGPGHVFHPSSLLLAEHLRIPLILPFLLFVIIQPLGLLFSHYSNFLPFYQFLVECLGGIQIMVFLLVVVLLLILRLDPSGLIVLLHCDFLADSLLVGVAQRLWLVTLLLFQHSPLSRGARLLGLL